ncbi:MAG TPA: phenylalanine--tRNA ligase subunit alpha, partial [Acidimicrobiales bacterium]
MTDQQFDADSIRQEGEAAIAAAPSTDELSALESELLGKKSTLAGVQRTLGGLTPDERKVAGQQLQEVRVALEAALQSRREDLAVAERAIFLAADRLDLTEVIADQVRSPLGRGHLHLVTQARDELEDTFVGMGFVVAEGPEAESDWYNFEALNMPPAHPARGTFDTMYLDVGEPETVLLRTHTSPVQIHLMEEAVRNGTLPIHAVMPGKCFRLDTPDARHLPVFNQIEGLVVDRGITFGDLAGTIQAFTEAYFGEGMQSRLRPAYFPFTEPSAEFEITCTICHGVGCRTCSGTGWVELGGCGMVDPAVFAAVGIDAEEWSGFA